MKKIFWREERKKVQDRTKWRTLFLSQGLSWLLRGCRKIFGAIRCIGVAMTGALSTLST